MNFKFVVFIFGLIAQIYAAYFNTDYFKKNYVIDHNNVVGTADMPLFKKGHIVWFPESLMTDKAKKLPVLSWANGTGCIPALYYEFLSQVAASGYIIIANTELFAGNGKEQKASIDFLLKEAKDKDSIFYDKVDETKIGVMGHSQGGMSSVNCANIDDRVKVVYSIAGNSYTWDAKKLKVPTFFVTGERDLIVASSIFVKNNYKACTAPAVYGSVKGAIHTNVTIKPAIYSKYAIKWFDAYLKDGDKSIFRSGGELFKDSDWTDVKSKNI